MKDVTTAQWKACGNSNILEMAGISGFSTWYQA
jgi:hypothetical protein